MVPGREAQIEGTCQFSSHSGPCAPVSGLQTAFISTSLTGPSGHRASSPALGHGLHSVPQLPFNTFMFLFSLHLKQPVQFTCKTAPCFQTQSWSPNTRTPSGFEFCFCHLLRALGQVTPEPLHASVSPSVMRTAPSHYEEQTRSQPRSQVPGSEKESTSPVSSSLSFRPSFISRGVLRETYCSSPPQLPLLPCFLADPCFSLGIFLHTAVFLGRCRPPALLVGLPGLSQWLSTRCALAPGSVQKVLTAARSKTGAGPWPSHFLQSSSEKGIYS